MSLPDVGRALRERWLTVAAVILAALVLGGALWALRPPTYTATLTVYAAPRPTDPATTSPESSYQGNLLAKERVPSYVQLVTSPQVLSGVIARARLDETVSGLANRVTATSAPDSVLVDVAIQGSSAAQAVGIAEAMSQVLPAAVDQLEQAGPPGSAPVSLRVIRPIPVPDKPSTPGLGLTLGIALLAGVVLGVAIALVRDALDRSLRTAAALGAAVALPVLGSLPVRRGERGDGPGTGRTELAEAYRQLRTAVHSAATSGTRHARPGVLVVTSPGPAEGRTSAVVELAAAAAGAGTTVLVVDADLRRPRAARLLGVESGSGLTDVLSGAAGHDAAVRSSRYGVDVLAAGPLPSNPAELLAGGALADVFEELAERWDLVLVDVPPVLPVTDAVVAAAAADGVVVLARRGTTTDDDLAATVRNLTAAGAHPLGTVLVADPDHRPALVEAGEGRATIAPRRPVARRESADAASAGAPTTVRPVRPTAIRSVPGGSADRRRPGPPATPPAFPAATPPAPAPSLSSPPAGTARPPSPGRRPAASVPGTNLPEQRPAANGSARNGVTGSAGNGTAMNGTAMNGTAMNGSAMNGSAMNGSAMNGSTTNGVTGSAANGTARASARHRHRQSDDPAGSPGSLFDFGDTSDRGGSRLPQAAGDDGRGADGARTGRRRGTDRRG